MRAVDFLSEIDVLTKDTFAGVNLELGKIPDERTIRRLPGNSGLTYSVNKNSDEVEIKIWDPNSKVAPAPKPVKPAGQHWRDRKYILGKWKTRNDHISQLPGKPVAKLTLYKTNLPLAKSFQVGTITVDEGYRSMGLAKALYGIVLTKMKISLVAGSSQTPGGRRNWLSLSNIPGVEVKGWVRVSELSLSNSKTDERRIDVLMGKLGGQYIGRDQRHGHYFAFDVVPGSKQLQPAVKTALSRLYGESNYTIGLYAIWTGQAQ